MASSGINHNTPELGVLKKLIALIEVIVTMMDYRLRLSFHRITPSTAMTRKKGAPGISGSATDK